MHSIRSSFCNQVHYFASREDAAGWLTEHPMAQILTVADAFEVGSTLITEMLERPGPVPTNCLEAAAVPRPAAETAPREDRTPMPPNQDDQRGGRGLLLEAVAALLVVGCCALLPLLVVGGTITGIGTLLRNPWVITGGAALLILAVVASIVMTARARRHRRENDPDCCPPLRPTITKTDPRRRETGTK